MRAAYRWMAVILGLAVLGGCSMRTERVGEPFSRVPEVETERTALGQQVFMQHCQQCHPHGEGGLAPELNDRALPHFLVNLQVRRGFGAMPGFPSSVISEEELDALNDYLRALRQAVRERALLAGPAH